MYNRYIPQADGTYRRNRIPDQQVNRDTASRPNPHICPPKEEPPSPEYGTPPATPCKRHKKQAPACSHRSEPAGVSISGFLRQVLPRDFDTGDLLVVVLLLFMSSDRSEDQNYALLTLALYLFL